MEGIEKVICCDKGNDALAYAAMANKQTDPMAMAAMMNGGMGNQWMNNPFAYMMFLALFGGAGAERGDASIISAIQNCCCNTQQGIMKMGYENQLAIQGQTESLNRSLNFVNSSIERGFSALGFQNAQDKCEIIRAGQDNTQRIIDTLNSHWNSDLQQRYNDARLELSQQRQNAELIAPLKTTAPQLKTKVVGKFFPTTNFL